MLVAEVGTIEILKELISRKAFVRFSELRKDCKIPQNTLVRRLKQLEENDLIERKVNSDRSVDYAITEKGKKFYNSLLKTKELLRD